MAARGQQTLYMLTTVLALGVLGYFLYHTVQGEHGWIAMLRLKAQVQNARATLTQLQKEHQELGHRVDLLRPESIDPDLLDEKSRELLDYSKPNEIIILTKPEPATPAIAPVHDVTPNDDASPSILQRSK